MGPCTRKKGAVVPSEARRPRKVRSQPGEAWGYGPKDRSQPSGNPQAEGTECAKAQRTCEDQEEQATEGPRLSCTVGSPEAGYIVEGFLLPEHM